MYLLFIINVLLIIKRHIRRPFILEEWGVSEGGRGCSMLGAFRHIVKNKSFQNPFAEITLGLVWFSKTLR